jgi:predicted nucleotidyltransferase
MKQISIKERILSYFFKNPSSKLRVRHIERILRLPLPSVIRYCKELEAENILKSELVSGIKLYSADTSSKKYLFEKKIFNLRSLYESGLIAFLNNKFPNPLVILFGSYSRGEELETSDIDIYIEIESFSETLIIFDKKLERHINILSSDSLLKLGNKDLANNILNGIILNGHLEVL